MTRNLPPVGMLPTRADRPIEEACYWLAATARPAEPSLVGDHEADVVIVGGGLTGLWTALHLKRLDPSRSVTVIEQGRTAYGQSGRNAGILGETIDHSHELALMHFGRAEAERLVKLGRENAAEMLATVEGYGIDAHVERTGTMQIALDDAAVAGLVESQAAAKELGADHLVLLDREAVQREIHCARYHGALVNPAGAILDPARLVEGLRAEILRQGVTLHEQTRITTIEPHGEGVRLASSAGSVRARHVVLATSSWTHQLVPGLIWRFIPFYDYIIVSEPLTPAQWEIVGWKGRQGATDTRSFFKYYRPTKDGRILWGTSEAKYYSGNRVEPACDHSPAHYAHLQESFVRHFPEANLRFEYAWGGPICATTRFTPFFGNTMGGRVHYGLGYTGHGLGTTHLAGKILAHMALAKPSPLLDLQLVTKAPFPYPPEPLRSWAVGQVTAALRQVDAGGRKSPLLTMLDWLGIGLSS